MKKRMIVFRIIFVSLLIIPSLSIATLTITEKQLVSEIDIISVAIKTSTFIVDAGGPYNGSKCNPIVLIGSTTDGCTPYIWDWDFGDGTSHSNLQNPTHQYTNDGLYTATLIVTDCVGVIDSDTAFITISTPILIADANGPYDGFTRIPINFLGSASGGCPKEGCKPYDYSWNFGDGGSSINQNPTHTYTNSGEYTVTFTVTDDKGNTDTDIITATIFGSDLDVDAGGPYYGDIEVFIQFYGNVEDGITPYTYHWDFGDGSKSEEQNPIHIYSEPSPLEGFEVTLYVSDSNGKNGWDQTIAYISGNTDEPNAIVGGPYDGFVNEIIQFNGNAFGGTQPYMYSWDFDDRNGIQEDSTLQNPNFIYDIPGIYNVTLTVIDDNDKIDEDKTTVSVLSVPDLECEGILNWKNIKQGTTVEGVFFVSNIGEINSKLNWRIDSYPSWGTWIFTPIEGSGLSPEAGIITVQVALTVPKANSMIIMDLAKNNTYTGNIIVVNKDNVDDFYEIPVSVTLSKSKVFTLFDFYRYFFFPFPFFEKILKQYKN